MVILELEADLGVSGGAAAGTAPTVGSPTGCWAFALLVAG